MSHVIIGCSAAGISAIEAIRSKDKKSKIVVITEEENPLYSRCLISYLLAGTIDEKKIWYRPESFFKEYGVDAHLGVRVEAMDLKKKEVTLENKEKINFNKLLLATGASAKLENIPGVGKKGVFPLRTIDHAKEIQGMLDKVKKVAVLGGGLVGLRAAYALKNRGKDVSVFVRSPQILSQIIDNGSAALMQKRIQGHGIKILTGRSAKLIQGKAKVEAVLFDNGETFDCELVIIGKGVSPNSGLAKDAGVKIDSGVLVDEFLKTSAEDIYASGDVAQAYDIALEESSINAVWPAACEQGRIAGLNMTGEKTSYEGSLAMNSIEFFGLPVISIGITKPKKDTYKEILKADPEKNVYKKIVLKNGVIVGAIFLGSIDKIGVVGTLIKNKIDVTSIEDVILEDYFDYGKIVKFIKDSKHGFKETEFKETILTL